MYFFFFSLCLAGLRGAIPYALSLHLGLEPIEKRQLIGTTTIIIVLFTILFLGGGTMPLIRLMDIEESQSRRKNKKDINLSKTEKMVMDESLGFHFNLHTHRDGLLTALIIAVPASHLPPGSRYSPQSEHIKWLIVVCVTDTQSAGRKTILRRLETATALTSANKPEHPALTQLFTQHNAALL